MSNFKRQSLLIVTGLLVCCGAFAIRIWLAANNPIMEHDDAISLLEATAHMSEMADIINNQTYPYFEVVPNTAWRQLIEPDSRFAFGQIAYDIAQIDRHTPMYFWLLHVWTLLFGEQAFSGAMLNIVLDLLTAILLFRFARNFFERPYALLVVVIWLLMPISIYVVNAIRPYALLAFAAVWYADGTYRTFFKPDKYEFNRWQSVGLVAAALLVISIHFYMVYIIGAGCLAVAARWLRKDWKRVGIFAIHLAVAGVLMLVLHPAYFAPFQREGTTFFVDMPLALERVLIFSLSTILDAPFHRGRFMFMRPLLVILIIGVPLLLNVLQHLRKVKPQDNPVNTWDVFFVFSFWLFTYLGIVGMYLAAITPLDYRYFAHSAVFAAVLPVFLLHMAILKRVRYLLGVAITCLMIVSAVLTTCEITSFYWNIGAEQRFPDGSELVLINMGDDHPNLREVTYRGHVLQVVYNLKPENNVLVAHIDAFMAEPNMWLGQLCDYETVLLMGFPNDELFELIEGQGFILESFPSYMYYTDTRRIRTHCNE